MAGAYATTRLEDQPAPITATATAATPADTATDSPAEVAAAVRPTPQARRG
jgi:hypothetical protein